MLTSSGLGFSLSWELLNINECAADANVCTWLAGGLLCILRGATLALLLCIPRGATLALLYMPTLQSGRAHIEPARAMAGRFHTAAEQLPAGFSPSVEGSIGPLPEHFFALC